MSRRPRRCLTRDVRCFLAFQTDVHQRLVHAQRARQRRGAVVANSVICQKSNVLITCASKRRRQTARTSQIQFRQRRVALERDGQRLGAVVAKTIHCSRTAVSVASRSENSSQAPRLPLKSTLASAVWRSSASDSALTPTRPTLLPAQETQLQQTNTLAPRRAALINAMRATDWLRFSPSANATWPSSPS